MRKRHYTQIGKEMDWHPLEEGVFGDARKIKIAVVGIGREAGASFVAANLAYHLAKHVDGVTYMEAEDAQIAETLEGRRNACYSLGLSDALGFADPLGRNREPDRKCECNCLPERDRSPEPDRKRKRDCDRALGLKHPTEPGRDQTYTADRNRESARPREHDCQHASEWPADPSREWSQASGRNREPDRSPEHGRPSDAFDQNRDRDRPLAAFSARKAEGKFADYFALEKEGLPVGSRRNLYANVNWAVRTSLEALTLSETCSENKCHAQSQVPPVGASMHRTVPLRTVPAETSTLETTPPGTPPIARQAEPSHAHEPIASTSSDDQRGVRSHVPLSKGPTDTQQGAPLRQPCSRPVASEPCMLAGTRGIGRIPGRYMIVDNPRPESLWEADLVICVVDPLPSRIRSGLQQLEALRDNRVRFGRRLSPLLNLPSPVLWLLNKDNPQAGHRELERSLNIKFDFAVPLLPPAIFYEAEYSSVPIFQMLESAGGRPHPRGSSNMQYTRTRPLVPRGADADGSPHSHCEAGAGKSGGRGIWQTGRAPAGASAGGSSGQPRSGCAAACSEFGRLAKRVLKLLD